MYPRSKFFLFIICSLLFLSVNGQRKDIDSLQSVLAEPLTEKIEVDIYNHLASLFTNVNSDTALFYADKALKLAEETDYKRGVAVAHARFGSAYFGKAEDDLSLESWLKSLELSRELNDSVNLCVVYHGLGIIYDVMDQEEDAIETLKQALEIAEILSLNEMKARIYLSMSIVSKALDQPDAAMTYIKNSLKISEDIGFVLGIISASNFLATLYIHQDKDELALEYLFRSLALSKKDGNPRRANYALIRIGRIYIKRGDYDKARQVLNEAVEVVKGTNLTSYEQDAYEELYVLDTLVGDYESAFKHFEKNTALKDTIFNKSTANRLRELKDQYEAEKRKQELEIQQQRITLLEKDQQIKAMWRNILILGIICILIAAILLIRYQRVKSEKKQKYLSQKIDFQNKELASYTINFLQKRNLFESVEENLKEVESSIERESIPKIRKIRRLIKQEDNIDRDWEEFKMHFESVHKDFFPILQKKHPDVRGGDLKLCALINLNMNIKEMSSILGISVNSVKTARYRLRKKLNLEPGDSLHGYISSLEKSISAKEF